MIPLLDAVCRCVGPLSSSGSRRKPGNLVSTWPLREPRPAHPGMDRSGCPVDPLPSNGGVPFGLKTIKGA